ncbi:MAG: helix-turn-helix domain-containing protein [Candidatus Bathyarchaeia archaeon]
MLGTQEENFQIFLRLGLTVSQTKVYLTLLKLGQTTGKIIAQHSKVARQEVYRVLAELRERGLVEKVISVPAVFKPLPIKDCLDILIKRKKDDLLEVEKKINYILQQTKNNEGSVPEEEPQLVLVSKKEASRRRLSKAIENTRVSCDMMLHWECFRYGMIEDTETWRKAVEKGAKIRFIVYKPKKEKKYPKLFKLSRKKAPLK